MFDSTHVYASGGKGGNSKSNATASITSPILVKSSGERTQFLKVDYGSDMVNTLFGTDIPYFRKNFVKNRSGNGYGYNSMGEYSHETCTCVEINVKQVVIHTQFMLVEIEQNRMFKQRRSLFSDGKPMGGWENVEEND